MARHHEANARPRGGSEGNQLDGPELVSRPINDVEGVVRVHAPLALPREVLAGPGDARGLEAGEPCGREARHRGRVVAERPDPE